MIMASCATHIGMKMRKMKRGSFSRPLKARNDKLGTCRQRQAGSLSFNTSSISCLDQLDERALPKRLRHPGGRGTKRHQSHHRFNAEKRSFRLRDGERRLPVEIAKRYWRTADFDGAGPHPASSAKRTSQCQRGTGRFATACRGTAFARYRFADGGNILPR